MKRFGFLVLFVIITLSGGCWVFDSNDYGNSGSGDELTIANLNINPSTLLLTVEGEEKVLTLTAYNSAGDEVAVDNVKWSSSHPDVVSVDSNGKVKVLSLAGSALITAEADGKKATALVMVAQPVQGAVLIDDSQVVSEVEAVDPDAPIDVGWQYTVTLEGVSLSPGDIVLSTGEAPVGGRVVQVNTSGDTSVVTIELVPVDELFSELQINETIPLKVEDLAVPDRIASLYDYEITPDGTVVFTPKQTTKTSAERMASGLEFELGPFECAPDIPYFPISLMGDPPQMQLTPSIDFIFNYDSLNGGLQKLAVKEELKGQVGYTIKIVTGFSGKVGCNAELFDIPVPIGGPLSYFIGMWVPVGIGFEIGGELQIAELSYQYTSTIDYTAEAGLKCTGGIGCEFYKDYQDKSSTGKSNWTNPSNSAMFRIKPELTGYGFADLEIGLRKVSWIPGRIRKIISRIGSAKLLSAKAGLKATGDFADVGEQVKDNSYASNYSLLLYFSLGPGSDITSFMNLFRINLTNSGILYTYPIGSSPTVKNLSIDKSVLNVGDNVTFTVTLDQNTVELLGMYNVSEVRVYRQIGGNGSNAVELIGSVEATEGQTEFNIPWTVSTVVSDSEFYAFVVSKLVNIPALGALEIGKFSKGGRIAFISYREGSPKIYIMDPDGSNQTRLTNNSISGYKPVWSPDGKKIAFVDNYGDIYIINADGSNLTRVTNNLTSTAWVPIIIGWSSDGKKIFFHYSFHIYSINTDGSNQTSIAYCRDCYAAMSPDGTKIAFSSWGDWIINDLGATIYGHALYIVNADGSGLTKIVGMNDNVNYEKSPAWSPDGTKIAFEGWWAGETNIYLVNVDGSNLQKLTNTTAFDYSPVWSPDGKKIAFISNRDGNKEIYVMNADGSNLVNLTSNQADDIYPVWSPDGTKIAFMSYRDGNWEIYVMNADGTNLVNLTNNLARDQYPIWQP